MCTIEMLSLPPSLPLDSFPKQCESMYMEASRQEIKRTKPTAPTERSDGVKFPQAHKSSTIMVKTKLTLVTGALYEPTTNPLTLTKTLLLQT